MSLTYNFNDCIMNHIKKVFAFIHVHFMTSEIKCINCANVNINNNF